MSINKPFFSIIIPVYNGILTGLDICLNSIWSQSLEESLYEVICVDDCSTDDTCSWLKEQQKKHHNLIVVENEKNMRQGGARNRGVEIAKGKYIMFIDHDDYYHQNSIVKVYKHLQEVDVDILICDSAYQFKGYEHDNLQLNLPFREVTNTVEFVKRNGLACVPWRMVFKRDLWIENDITFVENVRMEDLDWAIKMYYYAEKIQYQPILLVHYNKGFTSTTDNVYRDVVTLVENIEQGNRIMELANTLYFDSEIRDSILLSANIQYTSSCKWMFGLFCSIQNKIDAIAMIPDGCDSSYFVIFAKKIPVLYAIVSNISVPFFRFARKIRRWRYAKKLLNGYN